MSAPKIKRHKSLEIISSRFAFKPFNFYFFHTFLFTKNVPKADETLAQLELVL